MRNLCSEKKFDYKSKINIEVKYHEYGKNIDYHE
jgi:hypothetical protein